MTNHILLVDDDFKTLQLLSQYLQRHGYSVATAANGRDALREAYHQYPDLIVLDVMMPGMDGWETCARLRESIDSPIIMLTAKSTEADKLRGFRLGVDDYVTKPFSFAEIVARIKTVIARSAAVRNREQRILSAGDLIVDLDKRRVQRGGEVVALTPTEFRLLTFLLRKGGQVVSEEELRREVWRREGGDTSIVRRYILLLRKKLEVDPAQPTHILNVRGFGYRMGTAPLQPPTDDFVGDF